MSSHNSKNTISNLAKNDNWSSNHMLDLYQYQGFWYPGVAIDAVLKAQDLNQSDLQLSSSDIVLCSSPKTGTTWLKALAFSIASRTRYDPFSKDHPILTTLSHNLVPYIEDQKPRDPNLLPLLSTHIPYTALPKPISPDSSSTAGCKIVYICRNPKDAFVSLWHFLQKMLPHGEPITPIDKAFDLFCQGISAYGPYWDHVLGYWKASLNHPERVMFLKYEDMMEDAGPQVRRLAEFMGYPFSEEEERDGVLAKIVEMCSFGSLSASAVKKGDHHDENGVVYSTLFRKGKVGDWRNYLTDEMGAKLDEIFMNKLNNFGLSL